MLGKGRSEEPVLLNGSEISYILILNCAGSKDQIALPRRIY